VFEEATGDPLAKIVTAYVPGAVSPGNEIEPDPGVIGVCGFAKRASDPL
jgi:hypothetical protein